MFSFLGSGVGVQTASGSRSVAAPAFLLPPPQRHFPLRPLATPLPLPRSLWMRGPIVRIRLWTALPS